MGISSEVRLAAWMPAIRATSSGSPLGFCGSARSTLRLMATNACASASRNVGLLSDTSTIDARPAAS